MHHIAEFLKQQGSDDATVQYFLSKMVHADIARHGFILRPGQTEQYLWFIEKGILRFYVEKAEKEITFDFSFEGNFTSGYSSFLTREPATYYIQAMTPASLWRISYEDLQDVYHNGYQGQLAGRLAAEQLFIRKAKRELSLLTQTAEERYLHLLHQQADLLQQIPLKYLASYIGITPQALSHIRSRIS